jgi:hypothetical protein
MNGIDKVREKKENDVFNLSKEFIYFKNDYEEQEFQFLFA